MQNVMADTQMRDGIAKAADPALGMPGNPENPGK
jgi:hypothetical protein